MSAGRTKDQARLVHQLIEQGLRVELAKNGHYSVWTPKGKIQIAATPRSSRGVLNCRARLRRMGVKI